MAAIQADPNVLADLDLAPFTKVRGESGEMRVGDRYVIEIAGPWKGAVEVVDVSPRSFRLATLEGHMESGVIEMRTSADASDGRRRRRRVHDRVMGSQPRPLPRRDVRQARHRQGAAGRDVVDRLRPLRPARARRTRRPARRDHRTSHLNPVHVSDTRTADNPASTSRQANRCRRRRRLHRAKGTPEPPTNPVAVHCCRDSRRPMMGRHGPHRLCMALARVGGAIEIAWTVTPTTQSVATDDGGVLPSIASVASLPSAVAAP